MNQSYDTDKQTSTNFLMQYSDYTSLLGYYSKERTAMKP